ncbi:MAG: glycosyltransferase [Nitrosomonadales bacterium]|nr:glycosyltransferase [Nitrosomonadales bacterium]
MQKKFLIFGEFWQGTLPSLLESELRLCAYDVKIFDFTKIVPGISDRAIINRIKRRLFSAWYERQVNVRFYECASREKPDYIIVSKGINLWPETVMSLQRLGAKLINWNPDDFFNAKNTNANLMGAFKHYDLIVSSRPHLFDEYRERGAKQLLFIDWYYVPELHHPRHNQFQYNLTFVGSWSPFREEFISKIQAPVVIWGGGWERASGSFKTAYQVNAKIISQEEMSSIFSSSKYNLNLITHENRDLSNLRFFEVCASGGVLITERNESSNSYLVDGEDCLMYKTAEDVNRILASSFDLSKIAQSGYQKITNGKNSFSDRVEQLLEALH